MAEVFGIATGVLSAAAFAGQLAQSAAFLHGFIGNIKKAPKTVGLISEELRVLTSVLLEIQKSYGLADADIRSALQHCGKRLDELLAVIKSIDPAQYTQRRRRLWNQCKFALKHSDLEKYLAELERCKLMLVQACNNMLRAEQKVQTAQITSILQETQDSAAKQDQIATDTRATHATIQEIRQISSSLLSTTDSIATTAHETKMKMEGTSTDMNQILDNTELIRTMAERIESAQQTLIKDNRDENSASVRLLRKEVNETIATGIKQHLREHFETQHGAAQCQTHDPDDTGNYRQNAMKATVNTDSLQCSSQGDTLTHSRSSSLRSGRMWNKKSCSETVQTLTQNCLAGTTHIRTTTVVYTREDERGHSETKQVSTTVLTYVPPLWLTSRGAVFSRRQLSINGARSQSPLYWSLSTRNVVANDAEIIKACQSHDLGRITELFNEGLASPYDVDIKGLTLIGYLAVGVGFPLFPSKHDTLQNRLDEMNVILELLLEHSVDPGYSDIDDSNPISIMAFQWELVYTDLPLVSSDADYIDYFLKKLLKYAKNDPFSGSEALSTVSPYYGLLMNNFSGNSCQPEECFNITPSHLDLLLRQTEWPITWDSHQLLILCDPVYRSLSDDNIFEIHRHIAFWVTNNSEDVENYLWFKMNIIERFTYHDKLDMQAKHSVVHALHVAIHNGGETIALLTDCLHCNCFSGHQPRILHRSKKLAFLETWLNQLFCLLLTKCPARVMDAAVLDKLLRHAREMNAKTLQIWENALRKCKSNLTAQFEGLKISAKGGDPCGEDTSSEWEIETSNYDDDNFDDNLDDNPEDDLRKNIDENIDDYNEGDSEWETGEEFHDRRVCQSVRDSFYVDLISPDLRKPQFWDGCNPFRTHSPVRDSNWQYWNNKFNEDYWGHIYPYLYPSDTDSDTEEDRKGFLQPLAEYGRDFIATTFNGY